MKARPARRPRASPLSDPRARLALAAALAPFLVLVALLARYAVDVPFGIDWFLTGLVDKAFSGTLSLADLWIQHSDHRILFPNIALVALARLTRWDTRWEVGLNVLAALGTLAVVLRAPRERPSPWHWGLASLIVFSLSQWANWLIGIELCDFLSALASMAALACLGAGSRRAFLAGAVACAVLGSYTFACGAVVWPVGLALILAGPRAGRIERALSWCAAGAAVMALYFRGLAFVPSPPGAALVPWHARVLDWFAALGSPLCAYARWGAVAAGAAGVAIALWAGRRAFAERARDGGAGLSVVSWAAWAAGTALLIALGREGFGREQFLNSRYVTLGNPLWLADVTALLAAPSRGARRLLLGLITAAALVNTVYGAAGLAYRGRQLRLWREELLAGGEFQGLAAHWPDRKTLLEVLPFLLKDRLSLFREPVPAPEAAPLSLGMSAGALAGSVERVALEPGRSSYRGWAADLSRGEPAAQILFIDGKRIVASGRPYIPRFPLAWSRGRPGLLWSGFDFAFEDASGGAALRVIAVGRDGVGSELTVAPRAAAP
jgi:hypothetical protein